MTISNLPEMDDEAVSLREALLDAMEERGVNSVTITYKIGRFGEDYMITDSLPKGADLENLPLELEGFDVDKGFQYGLARFSAKLINAIEEDNVPPFAMNGALTFCAMDRSVNMKHVREVIESVKPQPERQFMLPAELVKQRIQVVDALKTLMADNIVYEFHHDKPMGMQIFMPHQEGQSLQEIIERDIERYNKANDQVIEFFGDLLKFINAYEPDSGKQHGLLHWNVKEDAFTLNTSVLTLKQQVYEHYLTVAPMPTPMYHMPTATRLQ